MLRGLVSEPIGKLLDRLEPFGLIIVVGLLYMGWLWALVEPLMAVIKSLILSVVGL